VFVGRQLRIDFTNTNILATFLTILILLQISSFYLIDNVINFPWLLSQHKSQGDNKPKIIYISVTRRVWESVTRREGVSTL